ncbi:TIGR02391 family protein [Amycolatopsis sp. NPDC003865]
MIRYNENFTVLRVLPSGEENEFAIKGLISRDKAHFPLNSDVEVDDVLVRTLPNGKEERRRVIRIDFLKSPFGSSQLDHAEAETELIVSRPQIVRRRVELPGMHDGVSRVAGALFADRHYSSAIFEAFKAVEARVQALAGSGDTGQSLMGKVFSSGALDITKSTGRNADDERDGFKLLFMGAMSAIRNPRGHGEEIEVDDAETLEYLAFASMLMRRLDLAESRLNP